MLLDQSLGAAKVRLIQDKRKAGSHRQSRACNNGAGGGRAPEEVLGRTRVRTYAYFVNN